jgi:hypothetical protein
MFENHCAVTGVPFGVPKKKFRLFESRHHAETTHQQRISCISESFLHIPLQIAPTLLAPGCNNFRHQVSSVLITAAVLLSVTLFMVFSCVLRRMSYAGSRDHYIRKALICTGTTAVPPTPSFHELLVLQTVMLFAQNHSLRLVCATDFTLMLR